MRILKIEMENLNSLKGFWCINLEDPDYQKNHDLFVISGPTGAGKTTILDAITLALYGRTPRQESLAGSNEIMTRKTGSCMARVTYRCNGVRIRSEFSQKKARGKADGNLQPADCRIEELDSGSILYTGRVAGFAEKTGQLIKLNYKQFCASIMLAQGEFDSFLNGGDRDADRERERAAILAKLTGTERFKKIGERIGVHASDAARALKEAESRCQEQQQGLLNGEQVSELENEIASLEQKLSQHEDSLREIASALLWLQQLAECRANLGAVRKERQAYEEERQAFGDDGQLLTRIEQARSCKAAYQDLAQIRGNRRKDALALDQARSSLEALEKNLAASLARAEEAAGSWNRAEADLEASRPLWKQVRELDGRLQLSQQKENSVREQEDVCRKQLAKAVSDQAALQAALAVLQTQLDGADAFLSAHAADGELSSIISSLSALGDSCMDRLGKMERQGNTLALARQERERLLARKQEDEMRFSEADSRLKSLISREYAAAARIIREGLQAGKPCPVCGSLEHSLPHSAVAGGQGAVAAGPSAGGLSLQERQLGMDIQTLSRTVDAAREALLEDEKGIGLQEQKIDLCGKDRAALEQEQETDIARLLSIIQGCSEEHSGENPRENPADTAENAAGGPLFQKIREASKDPAAFKTAFSSVLSNLEDRKSVFESNQRLKIKLEKDRQGLQGSLASIHLDTLNDAAGQARQARLLAEQELAALREERKTLFGAQDVDRAEEALNREAERLRREKDAADRTCYDLRQQQAALEGQLSQLDERLVEEKEQEDRASVTFSAALAQSGIADEAEYLNFIRDEGRYDFLRARAEELKERDTSSRTRLETSEKALSDCLALHKTDRSAEELEERRRALEQEAASGREQIGRDRQILKDNERGRDEADRRQAAYEAARKENDRWQVMKQFIGKADGSDLEVFVQALAFKNLLARANRYLFDITGRYRLVQVAGGVDFKVKDMNFMDDRDDRPVSTMSGGEKFIISLSLALGIAELASRSVSVDSLFLDEGFGTLSGKPLTQAVDALKQLQRSGKMLGIITHVDAVIKEFDQRIELVPVAGGFSELRGSGISRGGPAGSPRHPSGPVTPAVRPSASVGTAPASAADAAGARPSASARPARSAQIQGELFG